MTGPGHGGPALVASTYLEGTYSEVYPHVGRDAEGVQRLCRQFSTPGGIPSHVSVQTPGSIHEGGDLGYALAHAGGAAFDRPELLVACVIGDGEAETGPLSASWKLPAFLNPHRDGAVLPILHLNGAKIAGPTVLGRSSDEDVCAYLAGQGWEPVVVAGDDPRPVFRALEAAVASAHARIAEIRRDARSGVDTRGRRWPAVVLRTPKGSTGPHTVDGVLIEGTHRAHQVPLSGVRDNPAHLALLEAWMERPVCAGDRRPRRPSLHGVVGRWIGARVDGSNPGAGEQLLVSARTWPLRNAEQWLRWRHVAGGLDSVVIEEWRAGAPLTRSTNRVRSLLSLRRRSDAAQGTSVVSGPGSGRRSRRITRHDRRLSELRPSAPHRRFR